MGDLFATWNYFNAVYYDADHGIMYGVDTWEDQLGNTRWSNHINLPSEYHKNLELANKYWNLAIQTAELSGDTQAIEYARTAIEQIYPEFDILERVRKESTK